MTLIELAGSLLALAGSMLACYGVWVFNIHKDPDTANYIWRVSNPLLFTWSVGYLLHYWDGLLPMAALSAMYGYYTAASWWGWIKIWVERTFGWRI